MGGDFGGIEVRRRRARRARVGWWLAVLLPAALFISLSYRPVVRLKAEPPPGFTDLRHEWDAKRRAAEERTARAYWQLAANALQWNYPFGGELPDEPVPEFRLNEREFPPGSLEFASATRTRYWKKLREFWPLPQAWERNYEWSTGWLHELLISFSQAVRRLIDGILRGFGS